MRWSALIVIAIGIAVALSVGQKNDDATPETGGTVSSVVSIAPADPKVEGEADPQNPDPVSIPALIAYQPTGRDLAFIDVQSEHSSYTRYTISYQSDDLTISGIMNIPHGEGPFPVYFLNHGYIDPEVYTNGRGLKREQDYLARQGFAVLHSDYRCHAQSDCPDDTHVRQRLNYAKDVLNAVEAVRTSGDSRLSPTDFGMLGHSMGGGVTQILVTAKPDLIDAAVLYAPVSSSYIDSYQRYIERRPERVNETIAIYGTLEENPEFWNNLSPRTFFDRIETPLLYIHGTSDDSVQIEWSDASVAALRELEKTVDYVKLNGQPHEFGGPSWTHFMERSRDWLRQWLVEA